MMVFAPLDNSRRLCAELDPAAQDIGRALLRRLAVAASDLDDGDCAVVQVGWATVRLTCQAGAVAADEPDYLGDPWQFQAGLRLTCRILAAERDLLELYQIPPSPVAADQTCEIDDAALAASSIVGLRCVGDDPGDTGWRIVPALDTGLSAFRRYSMCDLARLRPEWFVALGMAPHWGFRFIGARLAAIEAPDGQTSHMAILPLGDGRPRLDAVLRT